MPHHFASARLRVCGCSRTLAAAAKGLDNEHIKCETAAMRFCIERRRCAMRVLCFDDDAKNRVIELVGADKKVVSTWRLRKLLRCASSTKLYSLCINRKMSTIVNSLYTIICAHSDARCAVLLLRCTAVASPYSVRYIMHARALHSAATTSTTTTVRDCRLMSWAIDLSAFIIMQNE